MNWYLRETAADWIKWERAGQRMKREKYRYICCKSKSFSQICWLVYLLQISEITATCTSHKAKSWNKRGSWISLYRYEWWDLSRHNLCLCSVEDLQSQKFCKSATKHLLNIRLENISQGCMWLDRGKEVLCGVGFYIVIIHAFSFSFWDYMFTQRGSRQKGAVGRIFFEGSPYLLKLWNKTINYILHTIIIQYI